MGGVAGALGKAVSTVGKVGSKIVDGAEHLVGKGGGDSAPIDSTTGEAITPDAYGPAPDILKPDMVQNPPAWKALTKGALIGGLDSLQNRQQSNVARPVSFDVSQATLPADFYQPSTLYTQARKRFDPFYGG